MQRAFFVRYSLLVEIKKALIKTQSLLQYIDNHVFMNLIFLQLLKNQAMSIGAGRNNRDWHAKVFLYFVHKCLSVNWQIFESTDTF